MGDEISHPIYSEGYKHVHPIYEKLPGWSESTVGLKSLGQLPNNARNFISKLEHLVGVPVEIISTGPERDETIVLNHPFNH